MKPLFKPLSIAFLALAMLASCKNSEKTASTEPAKTCIDPAKIRTDAMCIEIYDPVCGCDGKTYGNTCVAENAGVTSFTKGECK